VIIGAPKMKPRFCPCAHAETILSYNLGTVHGVFLRVNERTRLLLDVHTLELIFVTQVQIRCT
jgi:hypothetical protein